MNAADSVWDDRATIPGNLHAATKAADPTPANERRIIGVGPRVLTRQALSHWARWSTSGDHQRLHLRGLIGKADPDALEQLERNIRDLGPRQTWFTSRLSMKAGLPDGLIRGLTMDSRVLPALLKILDLHCAAEEKLEKALRTMERVEIINRPAASPVAAAPQAINERTKGEDMSAMKERVQKALQERKVDLREPVPEAMKRQIAEVLEVHSSTVNRYVVDLRRETEIEVDAIRVSADGTIKDRLKAQLEARKIDILQPVAMSTQEALAITLNTTKATVNGYLVQLRAEARKAAEKMAQEPVEAPELTQAAELEAVPVAVLSGSPSAETAETDPLVPAPSTLSEYALRAEIDTMRGQLEALASERESLRNKLSTWKEVAAENDRARVRWMDETYRLREEVEALKLQATPPAHIHWATWPDFTECPDVKSNNQLAFDEDGVTCPKCLAAMAKDLRLKFRKEFNENIDLKAQMNSAMVRQDAPASLPVTTVPQAITNAEVRELAGYEALGADIGRLVTSKQEQYGDSFGRSGDVLRQFYPDGIRPEQMDDALAVVRITDKLFRIAAGNQGGENAYADIAGYGLLGAAKGGRG